MCVLPERQVNSAYFTYLIVIQVSAWQRRHFHPSASFATTTASAGAAALFCSPAPTALLQVPPLPPSLLCLLGCRAVLPHPVPPRVCCLLASLLRLSASAPAAEPAPGRPWAQTSRSTGGRRGQAQPRRPVCLAARGLETEGLLL